MNKLEDPPAIEITLKNFEELDVESKIKLSMPSVELPPNITREDIEKQMVRAARDHFRIIDDEVN